jgi:hypothetical protein
MKRPLIRYLVRGKRAYERACGQPLQQHKDRIAVASLVFIIAFAAFATILVVAVIPRPVSI